MTRLDRIYQVLAPGLAGDFPPLQTSREIPNNLPVQLTSFIGRRAEVQQVRALVSSSRLLTLTGAGGCGKTRLALQAAAELIDDFRDGAWLIELASLVDPTLVPATVAGALGLREQQGLRILDLLFNYLRTKQLLLILDNAEHLIEASARFADGLLRTAPGVRLLVTSREALGIPGEHIYHVLSMQMPNPYDGDIVETLAQVDAVRLFVERARAVQPKFALTGANATAIVQICRRLDGIPLAIELAASRVPALSAEQIEQRLDDAFRLLTGGSRTALPRQQTLRALIAWSYNLLSTQERLLLHRLSVFAGSWTLEAAEAVCADKSIPSAEVLDLLARLVAKSLVVRDEQDSQARYRFLETIRLYAREKLLESGEAPDLRQRHLEFVTRWAEAVEPRLRSPEQFLYQRLLESQHDDLRAALEWSVNRETEKGLRLASALAWFWDMGGYWKEGLGWLRPLLTPPQPAADPLLSAHALFAAGLLADSQGEYTASREYLERAVSTARDQGKDMQWVLALALCMLGRQVLDQDPPLAQSLLDEGWTIAQELADQWLIARMLFERARWLIGDRDHEKARALFEKSATLFRSLGDRKWESFASYFHARVDYSRRDYAAARSGFEQGLPFCYETNDRLGIWDRFNGLGEIARSEGNYARAREYHSRGYALAHEMGRTSSICISAGNLGAVRLRDGDPAEARRLFEEALRLKKETGQGLLYELWGFAWVAAARGQMRRATK